MPFNPDIHHRRSIRLKDYDYAQNGAYFVTLCSWQRESLYGDIVDGKMRLNAVGQVVESLWRGLPDHFSGINLDEFVIMPNHFHGIIEIVGARYITPVLETAPIVGRDESRPTIGEIVRGFKARCTHIVKKIRNNPGCPLWQRNYYERVIRHEAELATAREYIVNNPLKWELDRENPANLIHI
jgi:putative transposase